MTAGSSSSHFVRNVACAVGAVVLALSVVLALEVHTDPLTDSKKSHLVGARAPSFDLPTLNGARVRSSELVGKTVIVNFWNSWCIPCRQEHPALVQFYREHASEPGFVMIGIVRDDTEAAIRSYVAAEGVPYTVAFDPGGKAALDFGTRGQPETYAIAPDGFIVASNWGPSSVANLDEMLRATQNRG